jgi:catechol 2,3-dioxygenase-like lactoylglutathione lyase family enzyme
MKLELIPVPVSDIDQAIEFYVKKVGFELDHDVRPFEENRIVQLTPPGSACSITIGVGLTDTAPGTYTGMHLVVSDIQAARTQLVEAGVGVSEPYHFGEAGKADGIHPERIDYGTFMELPDPDGNLWLVQEVGHTRAAQ